VQGVWLATRNHLVPHAVPQGWGTPLHQSCDSLLWMLGPLLDMIKSDTRPRPTSGGPVTISNCGGSDADNVCGAGTMTKAEAGGWNNRVWDERPCCWDCECTGARWKVVADKKTLCGFSAWSAAGSTDKDGNHKMASYMLQWHTLGNLKAGQGGPDDGYSAAFIQTGLTFAADIAGKFLEVHLTETGADLVLDGATIHSIASAPADSQYRFGCATDGNGGGFTDLAYYHPRATASLVTAAVLKVPHDAPPPPSLSPGACHGAEVLIAVAPKVCDPLLRTCEICKSGARRPLAARPPGLRVSARFPGVRPEKPGGV
jgi:hypothetical protein